MKPGTRWGHWLFRIGDGREPALCYTGRRVDYWVPLSEIHSPFWLDHLSAKSWMRLGDRDDLARALDDLRAAYPRSQVREEA